MGTKKARQHILAILLVTQKRGKELLPVVLVGDRELCAPLCASG